MIRSNIYKLMRAIMNTINKITAKNELIIEKGQNIYHDHEKSLKKKQVINFKTIEKTKSKAKSNIFQIRHKNNY